MDDRRDAFEAIFADHHTAVLRYVERRVDDREQARELTMDCFEIAWRRFDPAAPFRRPWLLQTARNLVGDFYRKRDRERDGIRNLVDAAPQQDTAFDNVELQLALRRMPSREREVLELFYWDGLSAAEIAEVVGCRTSAAWKRLSRARESLRAIMEEPNEPPNGQAIRTRRASTPRTGGGAMSYAVE